MRPVCLLAVDAVVFLPERFEFERGVFPLRLDGFEAFFEGCELAVDLGEVDLHPA